MNVPTERAISRIGGKARQAGLAMVETVISIPLVIVIMLGVAELGNAILQYNALTQSVRDGARYISANADAGSTNTLFLRPDFVVNTQNIVAYGQINTGTPLLPGLNPADVTVTDMGDGNISVAASFDYQPLLIGGIPDLIRNGSIGGAFTMNAQVIVRGLV